MALATERLLEQVDEEVATAGLEFLSSPTVWSGYHGLAHVKNEYCIGEYISDDDWEKRVVRLDGDRR